MVGRQSGYLKGVAVTGEIMARRYPAPIDGADWTLSAVDVCAVALSIALSKHVPGWAGTDDEQIDRVAKDIIEALERPHTMSSVIVD